MSGHSKWSTIKRKKGAQDAKKSKIFGKLIREITVAAKLGGSDPNSNVRLKTALATARASNMPADNIKRAIAKASDTTGSSDYQEVIYEGYGPGGAAILVDALTDNRNRTIAEVRHAFNKYNGNLGSTNCVAWMFERKGYIAISKELITEEKLLEITLEAGAEDLKDGEDVWEVLTAPEEFTQVLKAIEDVKIETEEARIAKIPENMTKINEDDSEKLMVLLDALEDLDDIQNVWTNFDTE